MTLLELMERAGSRETNKIIKYVADGFLEMESIVPEKTTGTKVSIVADQRLYSFPTDLVQLLGVYRKYDDDGKYIRIQHIHNIDLLAELTSTGVIESDIIVI